MGVSGPVTGGSKGWAFGGPTADLDALGYRQDEYFLAGEAGRYGPVPGTDLGRDGRWQVEPVETAPFSTRLVVVRPEDPAAFNGTVVVLWNNVSAGYENFGGGDSPEVFENGYAYVAVSAQRVGIHGQPDNPQGLHAWDPERYGSLSIPSDDYSFDIFTQVANLVAPDRPREPLDVMGGLDVQRLIAQGASQSAARLASYLDGVQPITRRFDAFFLLMYFGGGTPLEVGDAVMTVPQPGAATANQVRIPEGEHLLRDDLGIPVMVVNTECEATSFYGVRQPDTDRFRYWEVAGASHVALPAMASSSPRMERDFGFAIPLDDPSMQSINRVSIAPVVDAALRHLRRGWSTARHHLCSRASPSRVTRHRSSATTTASREAASDCPRSMFRWRTTARSSSHPTSSPGWSASTRPSLRKRCGHSTGTAPRTCSATTRRPGPPSPRRSSSPGTSTRSWPRRRPPSLCRGTAPGPVSGRRT